MAETYFRQCTMFKRIDENSKRVTVSWLPEKYAVKGKFLKLKDRNKEWDDHWEVIYVGSTRKTSKEAFADSRLWMEHRKATDV